MTETPKLADYADMNRTMSRFSPVDVLAGQTCPGLGCDGTIGREENGAICRSCGRWLLRFF